MNIRLIIPLLSLTMAVLAQPTILLCRIGFFDISRLQAVGALSRLYLEKPRQMDVYVYIRIIYQRKSNTAQNR